MVALPVHHLDHARHHLLRQAVNHDADEAVAAVEAWRAVHHCQWQTTPVAHCRLRLDHLARRHAGRMYHPHPLHHILGLALKDVALHRPLMIGLVQALPPHTTLLSNTKHRHPMRMQFRFHYMMTIQSLKT